MEKEKATHAELTNPADGPGPFRLIATLGLAGFLSGACLVGAFLYTQPLIQAARARAMEAAIYEVLPGCKRFEGLTLSGGQLLPSKAGTSENRVFAGYDGEGKLIGYAIESGISGFQDVINGLFGYVPQTRTIVGLKILESRETPGLGDKIFKDAEFAENFKDLQVEPEIRLVKKGEKQNPNEVDAITGATISSKAVVGLLNNGVGKWQKVLERPATGK
jgi:electron transport complex protein RnfG